MAKASKEKKSAEKVSRVKFGDSRDASLPFPIDSNADNLKEYNSIALPALMPESKLVNMKEVGWKELLSDLYRLTFSLRAIRLRHVQLLNMLSSIPKEISSYYTDDNYTVFKNKELPATDLVKVIATLAKKAGSEYLFGDSNASIFSGAFPDKYATDMSSFLAGTSYCFKRTAKGLDILFLGGGTVDTLPPNPQYPNIYGAAFTAVSPTEYAAQLEALDSEKMSPAVKKELLSIYKELTTSLVDFLEGVIPGASEGLHTKARVDVPLNVDFSSATKKLAKRFQAVLLSPDDALKLQESFNAKRGKFISLIVQRDFAKDYVSYQAKFGDKSKRTSFEVGDKVNFVVNEQKSIGTISESKLKPAKPGKKPNLIVSFSGMEFPVDKDVSFVKTDYELRMENPDNKMQAALALDLRVSLAIHLPESFTRMITQTVKGKVPLTAIDSWFKIWQSTYLKGFSFSHKLVPKYVLPVSILHGSELFNYSETEVDRADENQSVITSKGMLMYVPKISDKLALEYEAKFEEALENAFEQEEPFRIDRLSSDPIYNLNRDPDTIEKRAAVVKYLKRFSILPIAVNWNSNIILTPQKGSATTLKDITLDGSVTPDAMTLNDWLQKPAIKAFQEMSVGKSEDPLTFAKVAERVGLLYELMAINGKCPRDEELLKEAFSQLKSEKRPELTAKLDEAAYGDLLVGEENFSNLNKDEEAYYPNVYKMYERALGLSYSSSNKLRNLAREAGLPIQDHPNFIDYNTSSFADMYSLNSLLGGRIWFIAMKHLAKAILGDKNRLEEVILEGVLYDADTMARLGFEELSQSIVPYVIVWSAHIPNSIAIFEAAQKEKQTLKPQKDFKNPKLPGTKGFAYLPHQLEIAALSASFPRFMVLDVSPGGGKTLSGLTEMINYMGLKKIKRPLAIVPPGLIANWCNDLVKVTKGDYNVVILSSATARKASWGLDRLEKIINNSPPNTIFVTTYFFLKGNQEFVMYGNKLVSIYGNMEWLRQFNFDYVAMDESHRTRNEKSQLSNAVLRFVTNKSVKYLRLLTGSFITNTPTDLVGQVRLINPAIFRTTEEFLDTYAKSISRGKASEWREHSEQQMRAHLSEFVAMSTFKKKHWAWLLPNLKERFLFVEPDDVAQKFYELVLRQTLEAIENDLSPKEREIITGKGVDEDDDDAVEEMGALLDPYIARLEQILTDPNGDPLREQFKLDYPEIDLIPTTAKVLRVIALLDEHFKGHIDVYDDNKKYDAITKIDGDENANKVLIFCKYKRSVNAILDAMPADYRKAALYYDAEHKMNLTDFMNKRDIKILVCVEDSIQEGFNLQIASRLIRVESVWEPGKLDQAMSRIHRPDPVNKFDRKQIFADWIITKKTLEVAKVGRLISKILTKARFDEANNPDPEIKRAYMALPKLPTIPMTTELFKEYQDLESVREYMIAYGGGEPFGLDIEGFKQIEQREFDQELDRAVKEGRAGMIAIDDTPPLEGSKVIERVPYVIDQELFDRDDLGLVKMLAYMDMHPEVAKDPEKTLPGTPVHCEWGNGIIQGANFTKSRGWRVKIRIAATGELVTMSIGKAYAVTKIDTNTKKLWEKMKGTKLKDTDLETVESPKLTKKQKRDLEKVPVSKIVDELETPKKPKKVKKKEDDLVPNTDTEENMSIELYPTDINGMPAILVAHDDPDAKQLKRVGFKFFGSYLFAHIKNAAALEGTLKGLKKKKFVIPASTEKTLKDILKHFTNASSKKKALDSLSQLEMKNFFLVGHKKPKDKNELRIYPVLQGGQLYLYANLSLGSSAAIRLRSLAKLPEAPSVEWDFDEGIWIAFTKTPQMCLKKVIEVSKMINVENLRDAKKVAKSMLVK